MTSNIPINDHHMIFYRLGTCTFSAEEARNWNPCIIYNLESASKDLKLLPVRFELDLNFEFPRNVY